MSRPLGNFRVGAPIGRGGLGEVFYGEDEYGEIYAIKVLRPELGTDPELVARFVYERNRLIALRSPHLVGVYDLVVQGPELAVVSDLVPGGDLRRLLELGLPAPAEVARIGAGIARGLAELHAGGVVHRDLKPSNVLLDERENPPRPRLTDFGITRPDATAGDLASAAYIAPELWRGAAHTAAGDLYALGIVLYELSCGLPPYVGAPDAVRAGHLDHAPGRPVGIPDSLWAVLADLTANDPGARAGSATQVAERLDSVAGLTAGAPAAPFVSTPPPPVRAVPAPFDVSATSDTLASPVAAAGGPEPAFFAAPVPAPASIPFPAAVPATAGSPPAGARNRRALLAGVGVLMLLLGVGAVWAIGGGQDGPTSEVAVVPEPAPAPIPTVETTPTPTPTASTPSPTATSTPSCVPFQPEPDGGLGTQLRSDEAAGQCRVDVRMVQEALGVVPADGFFGPITRAAVRSFQLRRCSDYPRLGVIDRWTWDVLILGQNRRCPTAEDPSPGPSEGPTGPATGPPTVPPTGTATPSSSPTSSPSPSSSPTATATATAAAPASPSPT